MSGLSKFAVMASGVLLASFAVGGGAIALDLEKAHSTAIQNCVNWNGLSQEYCSCVQDRVRAGLPSESYVAMMEYAQAYQENRRSDMAAMQVNADMSKALEPVDAVVEEAKQACKS
ncbi:MAG: hypothetical protein AAGA21_11255 [Pseudomonadota bacterium]